MRILQVIGVVLAGAFSSALAINVPQNVSASDGRYTGGIRVTWSAVEGASGYLVTRAGAMSTQTDKVEIEVRGTTMLVDGSVDAGVIYTYRVRAIDANGVKSGFSAYETGWRKVDLLMADSRQSCSVPAGGGSARVTMPIVCNASWVATTDADWITLDASTSVNSGEAEVAFAVAPNETGVVRRGVVNIAARGGVTTSFNVVQGTVGAEGTTFVDVLDARIPFDGGDRLEDIPVEHDPANASGFVAIPSGEDEMCLGSGPLLPGESAVMHMVVTNVGQVTFGWALMPGSTDAGVVLEAFTNTVDVLPASPAATQSYDHWTAQSFYCAKKTHVWVRARKISSGSADPLAGGGKVSRVSFMGTPVKLEFVEAPEWINVGESNVIACVLTDSLGIKQRVHPTRWNPSWDYPLTQYSFSAGGVAPVISDLNRDHDWVYLNSISSSAEKHLSLKAEVWMSIGTTMKTASAVVTNIVVYPAVYSALDVENFYYPTRTSRAGWHWTSDASAVGGSCAVSEYGGTDLADEVVVQVPMDGGVTVDYKFYNPSADSRLEFYADGELLSTVYGIGHTSGWSECRFDVPSTNVTDVVCRFVAGANEGTARAYLDNFRFKARPNPPRDLTAMWSAGGAACVGWNNPLDFWRGNTLVEGYYVYVYPSGGECPAEPLATLGKEFSDGGFENTYTFERSAGDYVVRVVSYAYGDDALTSEVCEVPVTVRAEDGFDLVDTGDLEFTFEGDAEWFVGAEVPYTNDEGKVSYLTLRSGEIGSNQSSTLKTTVAGPGELTFDWFVSSENNYDKAGLFIDDEYDPVVSISGESGWQRAKVLIERGEHTVAWNYSKDTSVDVGLDLCCLGFVKWDPLTFLGRVELDGPMSSISGGAFSTYTLYGVYSNATGEVRMPLPEANWTVTAFDEEQQEFLAGEEDSKEASFSVLVDEAAGDGVMTIQATADFEGETYTASISSLFRHVPFAEALDAPEMQFARSSDVWCVVEDETAQDRYAACIEGARVSDYDSTFATTVMGPGTLSFRWRKEGYKGSAKFYVDEVSSPYLRDPSAEWETVTCTLSEDGPHTFIWSYMGWGYSDGERMLVDSVSWVPAATSEWSLKSIEIIGPDDVYNSDTYDAVVTFESPSGDVAFEAIAADWQIEGEGLGWGNVYSAVDRHQIYLEMMDGSRDIEATLTVSYSANGETVSAVKNVIVRRTTILEQALYDAERPLVAWLESDDFIGQFKKAHTGDSAAMSVDHNDSGSSMIETMVCGSGTLSFRWAVSSQQATLAGDGTHDDGDYMCLQIDDEEVAWISGNVDWTQVEYVIPADPADPYLMHWVRWCYVKNGDGVSAGEDAAWLDDVQWKNDVNPPVNDGWMTINRYEVYAGGETECGIDFMSDEFGVITRPICEVEWSFDFLDERNEGCFKAHVDENGRYVIAVAPDLKANDILHVTGRFVNSDDGMVYCDGYVDVYRATSLNVALDNNDAVFTASGDGRWIGQFNNYNYGESAALCVDVSSVSGPDGGFVDPVESTLSMRVKGAGTLGFDRIVQTKSGSLSLYVDEAMVDIGGGDDDDSVFEWRRFSVAISGDGEHEVRWVYRDANPESVLVGLDHVTWTGEYVSGRDATTKGVPYAWLTEMGIDSGTDDWETTEDELAANGVNTVYECYVANLDPTDADSRLRITSIECVDGEWVIEYDPPAPRVGSFAVEGRENIDVPEEWKSPVTPECRFFRVIWKEGE